MMWESAMTTPYLEKLKAEMEGRLGCKIEIGEDGDSSYSCKMEYARNYARNRHVLRVNPARCVNAYPIFFNLLKFMGMVPLAKVNVGLKR